MKRIILAIVLLTGLLPVQAENDYKESPEYQALRDSLHHAFNSGDSAKFFPALTRLQDYLLKQNDLHAYYTQRCNEIVFQMNRQRIFEAYKLARQLSKELRERGLDSEMYMAYNMLGHLNRYCGNREAAKRNFRQVISMMEKAGYYESLPPIYMNLVNIELNDNPKEAQVLLDKAAEIASKYSPERVFDIQQRKTLSYFNSGDIPKFIEGYKDYQKGVAEGKSSVHGRSMEVYYEACMGNTDKAIELARKELGDDGHEAITKIYEMSGQWEKAFKSLQEDVQSKDSIVDVILINSMQGYRDELTLYDMERKTELARTITLSIIIALLLLLVAALGYIMFSHRKHMSQLKKAYDHALESDKLKAAFIQNMSHEVRTPLNIIAGFAQVIANPELSSDPNSRTEMADMIQKNTHIITNQIDEMLELSHNEATDSVSKDDNANVIELLEQLKQENYTYLHPEVKMLIDSSLAPGFTFRTNSSLLKRVLNALIDNAIKNTQHGSITLRAEADEAQLALTVEDTGCGVPAGEADRIFERFVKLDSFKAGLGLGLPLCKAIITRLGGSIRLDTSYNNGARFIVNLPL